MRKTGLFGQKFALRSLMNVINDPGERENRGAPSAPRFSGIYSFTVAVRTILRFFTRRKA